MIIDSVQHISKYTCLHPYFAKAFQYIIENDLSKTGAGTYVLEEDVLKAIFSEGAGKTKEASLEKFECHNAYIDIQVCISGIETMGWKSRTKCHQKNGEYNADKDVQFYNDEPDMYFTLHDGEFVIFFPGDVHAPMIGDDSIKKLVMKVKI